MDFGRNLLTKTMTSGLSVTVLDFSPASRRNRQEVPQEQPDEVPENHVQHPSFYQYTGEACFQNSLVFPICTGKRLVNNRLIIAISYIQNVNVSELMQDGP